MGRFGWWAPCAAVLLVAGCAKKPKPVAVAAPPPAAPVPAPPAPLPADPAPAAWRLRGALNVAALACRSPALAADYNRLLKQHRAALRAAHAAEAERFRDNAGDRWQAAFDADMTRRYNRYATRTDAAFCREAAAIAPEAAASPDLAGFAPAALARLEAPALPSLAGKGDSLAQPAAGVGGSVAQAPAVVAANRPPEQAATAATQPSAPFRVQLGAYTGRTAAEAAWTQVRARAPSLAAYAPRFEPVPGREPLTRLQLASAGRDDGLRLCALASAAGFDCIAVPARTSMMQD